MTVLTSRQRMSRVTTGQQDLWNDRCGVHTCHMVHCLGSSGNHRCGIWGRLARARSKEEESDWAKPLCLWKARRRPANPAGACESAAETSNCREGSEASSTIWEVAVCRSDYARKPRRTRRSSAALVTPLIAGETSSARSTFGDGLVEQQDLLLVWRLKDRCPPFEVSPCHRRGCPLARRIATFSSLD